MMISNKHVIGLEHLGMNDVPVVGGKNASLGEMISNLSSLGVKVPGGTWASRYQVVLQPPLRLTASSSIRRV